MKDLHLYETGTKVPKSSIKELLKQYIILTKQGVIGFMYIYIDENNIKKFKLIIEDRIIFDVHFNMLSTTGHLMTLGLTTANASIRATPNYIDKVYRDYIKIPKYGLLILKDILQYLNMNIHFYVLRINTNFEVQKYLIMKNTNIIVKC